MIKAWVMMNFPLDVDAAYNELRRLHVCRWELQQYGVGWKQYMEQLLAKRKLNQRGRRTTNRHGRCS